MNIVADANTQSYIVKRLRSDGYKVIWIVELTPNLSDEEVLNIAVKNQALLITNDKDFGEMVFNQKTPFFYGIILMRLDGLPSQEKCDIVSNFLSINQTNLLNTFTVITPNKIRTQKINNLDFS